MRAERVARTSKSRKIGVLRDRVIWAAENETLKNFGVSRPGSSSSVAEIWRGVAGIDREGARVSAFFVFYSLAFDWDPGLFGEARLAGVRSCAVRPSSKRLQFAFLCGRCRFARGPWPGFHGFKFCCLGGSG